MKLLFIPGVGSGKAGWIHQIEHFADAEAVLLPGHPEGEPCTSVEEYAEWLWGYVRRQGYRDVVLAGHSMGSAIALLYGVKYGGEAKALVLIGAGARMRVLPARLELIRGMLGDAAAWRKYLEDEYRHIEPEVRQAMIEERVRIGPAVALSDFLCCDRFDVMDRVPAIKLPTLLICGSADDRTPVKFTRYLADKIEGARSVIIDGATHWAHLDNPREVNRAIGEFLARLGSA